MAELNPYRSDIPGGGLFFGRAKEVELIGRSLRTGYKNVVEQVCGYLVPGDAFACVIMIDRQARPLTERYRAECLRDGTFGEILWPAESTDSTNVFYPAFVTRHAMHSGGPVRIYHFLVQLPPDGGPCPMPFDRHLPDTEIRALHALAIQRNLAGSRDTLLGGLDPLYVTSLPKKPAPSDQILSDLQHMNTCERIGAPPVIPLATWLANAHHLTSYHGDAARFDTARKTIERNAAQRAAAPSPPPAPTPTAAPRPARPLPAAAHPASLAFLSIADLKAMDTYEVHAAMTTLHRALRDAVAAPALADVRVLSSLTGAIVLVPDAPNRNLHDLLSTWLAPLDAAGLALRAGVSRGMVEIIPDADGTLNAIARCANIAARLAMSPANPGVLYDDAYANHVEVRRGHFLSPATRTPLTIKGKRDEAFTCYADPAAPARAQSSPPSSTSPTFQNAVLIAYDLPGFSDGDLRTLASRVRASVQEIARFRAEQGLPESAEITFSPGGDGGVFALTGIPLGRAFPLATELSALLEAASATQAAHASVKAPIAIHYGQVTPYENAEGTVRPTGLALFDADALAGDAEARRYDAVIVSEAIIESAARGMPAGFDEIAPFTTAQRIALRRYVQAPARRPAS